LLLGPCPLLFPFSYFFLSFWRAPKSLF
jgi:hypothetical protein